VGVATVHQGPGVTNTVTALAEATKSRTPLVVLAPEAPAEGLHTNQALDQAPLVKAVGAGTVRLERPGDAGADAGIAFQRAAAERRPIVLLLPTEILGRGCPAVAYDPPMPPAPAPLEPSAEAVVMLADALRAARRPLILAGRGAVAADAGPALRRLAARAGAVLSTTIVAKGLFADEPFEIGFLGGLASPLATRLAAQTDLLVAFGASLDAWTTCGGRVPEPGVAVALVDADPDALARHPSASLTVLGDAAATAEAVAELLDADAPPRSWRSPELAARLAGYRRSDDIPAPDSELLDPRRLAAELDELLPADRTVAVDSGHFLAFASMYLNSQHGRAFLFAQGFQSVGLGLAVGIGAAVARPGVITVAICGDGGAKMSMLELDTAVREQLPLVLVIFDDGGYGAEVHDFEPLGEPVDIARFPSRDYAAVGRALGAHGTTVRETSDLTALTDWLDRPDRPLVLDCKVDPEVDAVTVMTDVGIAEWSLPARSTAA